MPETLIFNWSVMRRTLEGENLRDLGIFEHDKIIAHTKSFFVTAGLGSFVPGYVLIAPKKEYASISAAISTDETRSELRYLVRFLQLFISSAFGKRSLVFEHGMCGCLGTELSHLHISPISNGISSDDLVNAINRTLTKRLIGITGIEIGECVLDHPHDIRHFIVDGKVTKGKLLGQQKLLADIRTHNPLKFQEGAASIVQKGGKYVYFKTPDKTSSFLTEVELGSQFARQVVFEAELSHSQDFLSQLGEERESSWNWRVYSGISNMITTINAMSKFGAFYTKKETLNHELLVPLTNHLART